MIFHFVTYLVHYGCDVLLQWIYWINNASLQNNVKWLRSGTETKGKDLKNKNIDVNMDLVASDRFDLRKT